MIKRVFDILISILVLLLLSPLLFLVAVLIILTDKGPIFYTHKRMGKYGTVFLLYKFRSMSVDINRKVQQTHSTSDGITRVGRFIRSTKIDELPQLANIPAFYYGIEPNKFFDYISAGLPIINNYPGWLAGMIEQTQYGFAVQPDDPIAFADALEKAANQKETLNSMGANARQLAENQFDRRLLADKWVDWVTGVNSIG